MLGQLPSHSERQPQAAAQSQSMLGQHGSWAQLGRSWAGLPTFSLLMLTRGLLGFAARISSKYLAASSEPQKLPATDETAVYELCVHGWQVHGWLVLQGADLGIVWRNQGTR